MSKPKITGVYHPLTHGGLGVTNRTTWTVAHDHGSYFTDSWDDALSRALCAPRDDGPQQIHLPPEPPRDRVIEARDEKGRVVERWDFSVGFWWAHGHAYRWSDLVRHIEPKWSLWSVPAEGGDPS
jgi:hypothetical protein